MNNDKAREFFSAFHEGTLEPGLRASLERRLSTDEPLHREYAAFVDTVETLGGLRTEAIEIPAYLSGRIAARLDPVLDARKLPFWRTLFAARTPAYGWAMGVAGAFLVAALGLRGLRVSEASTAGVLGGGADAVHWTGDGSKVVATFAPASGRKVGVAPEGGDAQSFRLAAGQPFELTLGNPNAAARRFRIAVGDDAFAVVAVPGTRPAARREGSGTVAELASALADAYRVPVVVKGSPSAPVRWSFKSADVRAAAEQGLDGKGSAAMMDGNVLQIGE